MDNIAILKFDVICQVSCPGFDVFEIQLESGLYRCGRDRSGEGYFKVMGARKCRATQQDVHIMKLLDMP